MMKTVAAVISVRKTARYACEPTRSDRNASSGPSDEDDRPSAPRPTQARNATSETWWKIRGSSGSRAFPTRIVLIVVGKVLAAGSGGRGLSFWPSLKSILGRYGTVNGPMASERPPEVVRERADPLPGNRASCAVIL